MEVKGAGSWAAQGFVLLWAHARCESRSLPQTDACRCLYSPPVQSRKGQLTLAPPDKSISFEPVTAQVPGVSVRTVDNDALVQPRKLTPHRLALACGEREQAPLVNEGRKAKKGREAREG